MNKIKTKADENLSPYAGAVLEDLIEHIKKVESPKGHPVINPMTWSDADQKIRWCLAPSAKLISDMNAQKVIQIVRDLKKMR